MGGWLPPLSCYHADDTQPSLLLHKVHCFHALWDGAILQPHNEPYGYKSVCILLKIIFHKFMLFCNYFYCHYFKHHWNKKGILHCKQILTLVSLWTSYMQRILNTVKPQYTAPISSQQFVAVHQNTVQQGVSVPRLLRV